MRRCLIVASLLTLGVPARALDQGGSVVAVGDAYRSDDPRYQGWLRGTYVLDAQPEPWVFFKVAAILEFDTHGDIRRDRLYDDEDRGLRRAPLRFRDLAVGFRAGPTTVTIGRQRLTWKRASFVNPTDNLTPRDWTDPLEEVRLSPLALDVSWERDRWSVEGALVPRYAPSRLPVLNERWFEIPPGGIEYAWADDPFPEVSWDNLQGGLRAGFRGSDGEVRVTYYRGFDDAPRIVPVGATLHRSFEKLEAAGLDGEVLLGAFILRAEAGYFHYPGGAIDGYGLYELEGEWSRSGWRLIAGFADALAGDPAAASPASLDLAYVPAFFFHVDKGDPTEWQVALDATVGTNDYDALVRLSGSYPFTSHLRAGGELDLMGGGSSTFWGRWTHNDRLRAWLRFDF